MVVDLTRVHGTANANEFEQALDVPAAGDAPRRLATARMHQAEDTVGDEAVVDEEVLVDVESRVLALEIARAVVRDPVAEHQILRTSRGANGVRLHEAERIERVRQGCLGKETPRDGVSAQLVDGHSTRLSRWRTLQASGRPRGSRFDRGSYGLMDRSGSCEGMTARFLLCLGPVTRSAIMAGREEDYGACCITR